MASRKFFSIREIEELLENYELFDELERETIDIVELPPDNVDQVSNCEELDNVLEDDLPHDVPGQLEVHSSALEENPTSIQKSKRKILSKSDCKKQDVNYSNITLKYDSVSEIKSKMTLNLKNKSPVDIFEEFFVDDLYNYIVTQNRNYARQNNRHNFELSTNCLKKFIGIFLLSRYCSLSQEQSYWCENEDLSLTCVINCIPKHKFLEIQRNLHLNDHSSIIAMVKKEKTSKI
ncbi:PiggyBac transposable element-derived protein 1 [Anthophora quadrimaculata]